MVHISEEIRQKPFLWGSKSVRPGMFYTISGGFGFSVTKLLGKVIADSTIVRGYFQCVDLHWQQEKAATCRIFLPEIVVKPNYRVMSTVSV